jgi:hypothetical protein
LYFVTGFVDASEKDPIEHLKLSAVIWVMFLLFTKMHLVPTIISFILVCASYLIHDYSVYYENKGELEEGKKYKNISNIILKCNIAMIIVSFIVYFVSKYKEYKGDFNALTFILGNPNCKGN